MVSAIVAKILNRTLGAFIDDLKSDQLDISLFSGTVKLENLSLKKTVLDNLPFPFRLEFGYVGRIFADIPIRNIGSAPVKIEVSNVFALFKLKDRSMWSAEAELKAFQDSKKSSLDSLEELQESARELKAQDPGYFSKLASKIVDNLQVNVENIYIRVEDDLTYPEKPCAFGVSLRKVSAVTTDHEWKVNFVSGQDEICKAAGINDLAVFFDYADHKESIFVEHRAKPYGLQAFVEFANLECSGKPPDSHRYLLSPLTIELRTIINKDPKKNQRPQIQGYLKIGSSFVHGAAAREGLGLGVEVQQITIGMKAMEYVGKYSKFQTEATSKHQEAQFSSEQKEKYEDVYTEYLQMMRLKNQKAIDSKRGELEKLEERFSLAAIKKVRAAAKMELDFEERKEEAKKDTEKKIHDLESRNSSALTSVGSFFGSASAKERQRKAREAVDKYREQLTKEQEEKLRTEREAIDKELKEIFSTAADIDVTTAIDLPATYERFKFTLEMSQFTVTLADGLAQGGSNKLVELGIFQIKLDAAIGNVIQRYAFRVESLDVFDFISRNKTFGYLVESRCEDPKQVKNCLNVQFRKDPTNPSSDLTLAMDSNCQLIFYVNFHTIFTLLTLLQEAVFKQKVELEYYRDFARAALSKLDEYVQLGLAFAKDTYSSTEPLKHFSINLLVTLAAPIIVVPCEPTSPTNSSALVCDLGTVRARSVTQRKAVDKNYREITDVGKLYDYYEIKLDAIQVYIAEDNGGVGPIKFSRTRKDGDGQPLQHKYVRDLCLQLRLYNCLEPMHPSFPAIKVGVILNRVDVVLTDYNSVYVLRILSCMQKEQRALAHKTAEMKQAAVYKLIKEQGGVEEAAKAAAKMVQETEQPEAKIEEKKVPQEVYVSPGKKTQEIMVHFDDINIVVGRTLLKGRDAYQEGYAEELKEEHKGEVPIIPDMRAGINGMSLYAFMTHGGSVSLKSHVFRIYVRDLQLRKTSRKSTEASSNISREEKYGLTKVVAKEFEYILSNPNVESSAKDRLEGDNYKPFKNNLEYFKRVESSSYLEEPRNQIDVSLEGNLKEYRLELTTSVNDIRIVLPYHSLAPLLYLLSEINSATPAAPETAAAEQPKLPVIPEQKELDLHRAKSSYRFGFRAVLKGVECETAETKYYRLGLAARFEGEFKATMEKFDPTTLRSEVAVSGSIDRLGMAGFDGSNNASWDIISPTEATVKYSEHASVAEDSHSTEIGITVKPIDAVMRIADTELLLEFTKNLMGVLGKHKSKQLPAPPPTSVKETAKEPSQPTTVLLAKAVEETERKASEPLPGTKALTENSSLRLTVDLTRLSFTAVNDKVAKSYPLLIAKLEGIKADVTQGTKKGNAGTSKEVKALVGSLGCELGLIKETEWKYETFLYRRGYDFFR